MMKRGALERYLIGPSVAAKKNGPSKEGKQGLGDSSNNKDDPSMLILKSKSGASPHGFGGRKFINTCVLDSTLDS